MKLLLQERDNEIVRLNGMVKALNEVLVKREKRVQKKTKIIKHSSKDGLQRPEKPITIDLDEDPEQMQEEPALTSEKVQPSNEAPIEPESKHYKP